MTKELPKWPVSWEVHLQKTFAFYFDGDEHDPQSIRSEIVTTDGYDHIKELEHHLFRSLNVYLNLIKWVSCFDDTTLDFRTIIDYKEKTYCAIFVKHIENQVVGQVMRSQKLSESSITIPFLTLKVDDLVCLTHIIKSITASNAYEAAILVEKIIFNDYWNNGGDNSFNPISPKDPSNSLDPVLI